MIVFHTLSNAGRVASFAVQWLSCWQLQRSKVRGFLCRVVQDFLCESLLANTGRCTKAVVKCIVAQPKLHEFRGRLAPCMLSNIGMYIFMTLQTCLCSDVAGCSLHRCNKKLPGADVCRYASHMV